MTYNIKITKREIETLEWALGEIMGWDMQPSPERAAFRRILKKLAEAVKSEGNDV